MTDPLVLQAMKDQAPSADEAMIQRALASLPPSVKDAQGSYSPYGQGMQQNPNLDNKVHLDPGTQQVVQKILMEEMAKQKAAEDPYGLPQTVKKPAQQKPPAGY